VLEETLSREHRDPMRSTFSAITEKELILIGVGIAEKENLIPIVVTDGREIEFVVQYIPSAPG